MWRSRNHEKEDNRASLQKAFLMSTEVSFGMSLYHEIFTRYYEGVTPQLGPDFNKFFGNLPFRPTLVPFGSVSFFEFCDPNSGAHFLWNTTGRYFFEESEGISFPLVDIDGSDSRWMFYDDLGQFVFLQRGLEFRKNTISICLNRHGFPVREVLCRLPGDEFTALLYLISRKNYETNWAIKRFPKSLAHQIEKRDFEYMLPDEVSAAEEMEFSDLFEQGTSELAGISRCRISVDSHVFSTKVCKVHYKFKSFSEPGLPPSIVGALERLTRV
jgi:hypothetical protein